jgi:hypothetical protein
MLKKIIYEKKDLFALLKIYVALLFIQKNCWCYTINLLRLRFFLSFIEFFYKKIQSGFVSRTSLSSLEYLLIIFLFCYKLEHFLISIIYISLVLNFTFRQ